jgi:hypothetical protein
VRYRRTSGRRSASTATRSPPSPLPDLGPASGVGRRPGRRDRHVGHEAHP